MAPPGWTPAPGISSPDPAPAFGGPAPAFGEAVPAFTSAVPAFEAADAAVRWRVRAARVDNAIVCIGYLAICLVLHWRVASLGHIWLLLVAGVAYHFALEAHDGQTIGKRRYGIRVVGVDGGPASVRAVAIRSVLRIVDQLPVSYVSGLVSMVRTGPARRQRIGDVAAGTMVIAVDGRAAREGTPGWMLPVATVFAVAVSALWVIGLTRAGSQPLTAAQQSDFIAGCQSSAYGAYVDCGCLLTRLEADGYDTPNALNDLQSSDTTSGPAQTEVKSAVLACRR